MISASFTVKSSSFVVLADTATEGLIGTGGTGIWVTSRSVGLQRLVSISNRVTSSSLILERMLKTF